MKLLTKAASALVLSYIALSCLISCTPTHNITFVNEACIIPWKQYDYHTCAPMHVNIDEEIYVIPKDFTTDLASIPQPLWPIIAPQYAPFVAPSILHDYLYSCGNIFNRRLDDEIFYSALINNGVGRATAAKLYFAVRIFGAAHFDEHNNVCTRTSK